MGRINKPIQLNAAPALPNAAAPLQRCRRQQHPLLIRWSFASESGCVCVCASEGEQVDELEER